MVRAMAGCKVLNVSCFFKKKSIESSPQGILQDAKKIEIEFFMLFRYFIFVNFFSQNIMDSRAILSQMFHNLTQVSFTPNGTWVKQIRKIHAITGKQVLWNPWNFFDRHVKYWSSAFLFPRVIFFYQL